MQIRIRNGKTEFLRASYNKEKKRSEQKLIKQADFSEDEAKQYAEYCAAKKVKDSDMMARYEARSAHTTIASIAAVVEAGYPVGNPQGLLESLDRLNFALRKAKITRPAKPKVDKIRETATGNLDL